MMRHESRERLAALLLALLQLTSVLQAGSPAAEARPALHVPDAGAYGRN
jgi:hypothetical protein